MQTHDAGADPDAAREPLVETSHGSSPSAARRISAALAP